MTHVRDTDRLIRAYLEEGVTELPDRAYDAVRSGIDRTRQRVVIVPWRIPDMNGIAKLAIAAAAVLVVAVVGVNVMSDGGGLGGPAATPAPTPLVSPSPSPGANSWPTGPLEIGRHEANLYEIPFSFDLPSSGWQSYRFTGMIEKGTYPAADYRWIGFLGTLDQVSTDPCAGVAKTVGPAVTDLASALTTIPGTHAVGPTETVIGGLPAKLVVLTLHDDIGCDPSSFWLFGDGSAHPNTIGSTIRVWVFQANGTRQVIQSDQAGTQPEIGQEIQRIVDSIRFE